MKLWTADSLKRALEHHGVTYYYRPERIPTQQWTVETGIGPMTMTEREVHGYVVGRADSERKARVST